MNFEWDESKNRANAAKHQVDFDYAICVFDDKHRIEFKDERRDYGESRLKTVGNIDGEIIVVIYTIRNGIYRIISARKARKDERQNYTGN